MNEKIEELYKEMLRVMEGENYYPDSQSDRDQMALLSALDNYLN